MGFWCNTQLVKAIIFGCHEIAIEHKFSTFDYLFESNTYLHTITIIVLRVIVLMGDLVACISMFCNDTSFNIVAHWHTQINHVGG